MHESRPSHHSYRGRRRERVHHHLPRAHGRACGAEREREKRGEGERKMERRLNYRIQREKAMIMTGLEIWRFFLSTAKGNGDDGIETKRLSMLHF